MTFFILEIQLKNWHFHYIKTKLQSLSNPLVIFIVVQVASTRYLIEILFLKNCQIRP